LTDSVSQRDFDDANAGYMYIHPWYARTYTKLYIAPQRASVKMQKRAQQTDDKGKEMAAMVSRTIFTARHGIGSIRMP